LKGGKQKRNRIGSAKADKVKAEKIAEKTNASLALGIFPDRARMPRSRLERLSYQYLPAV
jgi:hypothetical protein